MAPLHRGVSCLLLALLPPVYSFSLFSQPAPEKCPYTWVLYPNGADKDGTSVILPPDLHLKSEADFNAWAAAQIGHEALGLKEQPCYKCSVFDASGRKITHCSQLDNDVATSITSSHNFLNKSIRSIAPLTSLEEGGGDKGDGLLSVIPSKSELNREAWVVAPNRWFLYPVGKLGRAVEIKRVVPPRGDKHPIIVESISNTPRAFHLHNFVTFEEADALIEYSLNNKDPVYGLHRSTTGVEHEVSFNDKRTSENAFDVSSPTALLLKRRAMAVLGMEPYDERLTDGLQVLRYNKTKAYNTHLDYLDDNGGGHDYDSAGEGANRFATILFYLSDVEEGGETVFPNGVAINDGLTDEIDGVYIRDVEKEESELQADWQKRRIAKSMMMSAEGRGGNMSANSFEDLKHADLTDRTDGLFAEKTWQARMIKQCQTKLAVKPRKAHAVIFYSQTPTGSLDRNSLHGACPVIQGTKWAANLWIWNKIRLGYAGAPRKQGAKAYDPTQAVSRDRLLQKDKEAGGANGAVSAKFINRDFKSATIYWEETKFADFPIGSELPVNTFTGHQWYVKGPNSELLAQWVIGHDPSQVFELKE